MVASSAWAVSALAKCRKSVALTFSIFSASLVSLIAIPLRVITIKSDVRPCGAAKLYTGVAVVAFTASYIYCK